MAGSKGNNSASSKAYYAAYNPQAKRRKRLERHLKNQPNDVQAQEALKNPQLRAPKVPNNKNGWLTRDMLVMDFIPYKKGKPIKVVEHVDAKAVANVRSVMKKSEAKYQHEKNYASKEDRKQGGQKRG